MAGQDDWAEQIAAAQATLRAAGWDVALHRTAKQGDATALARAAVEDGADVVIVAGGDGTVNEALQGLAGQRRTALAVLPGGTVNVWATELGADQHEVDIARRIATGRRHAVDLGKVNDRCSSMASIRLRRRGECHCRRERVAEAPEAPGRPGRLRARCPADARPLPLKARGAFHRRRTV
ncbi:MAG: acylglycerol kinase family protein [Thermomicrobiales bacterium]